MSEKSEKVGEGVVATREIEVKRFWGTHIYSKVMSSKQLKVYCQINDVGNQLLKTATEKLNLSASAYDRI